MQRSTATLCVGDGVLIYFGERSHLLNKDINLDTHITNTVNVIKWEDLNDICLVVHSYGGWVGSAFPIPPPKLPPIFVNAKDRDYVDSKLTLSR